MVNRVLDSLYKYDKSPETFLKSRAIERLNQILTNYDSASYEDSKIYSKIYSKFTYRLNRVVKRFDRVNKDAELGEDFHMLMMEFVKDLIGGRS